MGGGIPSDVPRLELKLIFKEGGHDAFQNKFEVMKERLSYARTLQQETGQVIPTGEDLPRYEPAAPSVPIATSVPAASSPPRDEPSASRSYDKERESLEHFANLRGQPATSGPAAGELTASEAVSQTSSFGGRASTILPDEPPPDYEEAQAQAIGMRFEESAREAADRQ